MKKILLLTLVGMSFFIEPSVGAELVPYPNSPTGVWIKLHINLHRQKFDCQRGFGLCFLASWGFEASAGSAENTLCTAKGMINERNQLLVEIDEDALAKYEGGAMLPNFRNMKSITIQDPYVIPEPTCKALGAGSGMTIKPGTYPILHQNHAYTIVFQL